LKTGPISSPETSVSRCQPTSRNASEDFGCNYTAKDATNVNLFKI